MEPRRMETPNRNSEDYSMKDACWKRLVLPVLLLTVPLVLFCPVHAQTIIWVGDGFDDDFDGVQDDSGWVDLLTNQGYTVDNRPTYWSYLTTGKIAELEAADLVIVSRNTDSGQYDDGAEVAQWNGIATPLILMSAHIARSSRWRFFNSTEVASTADPYLMALDTGHPAFAGVTLAGGNLVNVLDGTVGPSSFVCVTTAGNGTVVARQAGGGYVWIAEWQAGTEYYSGAGQMAGGPRVWLVGGTQEGGGVGRGEENYTPDGEAIFLNLVAEFTGGANQPPEVDAGPDRELTMPSNMLTLDATVSDDGLGLPNGHLALEWSLVSGPGTVRFDPNAYVEDPRVTFERHRHGEYVLRLDASDGELDAHDTVTVTIHEPICPVGDLNADCKVDALDLHLFSLQWLTASGGPADFSGDDLVNLDDYRWLADNWLENWQTGSLLVTLYPLEVNSDGARWRVDGGDWLDGGVPVTDLAVGPHPVDFSPVAGWDTPSSRQVQIVYEQTTTTSATYIRQTGSLQVYLYPPEAVGAQWRVGEFAWKDSGEIQTGLPTGDYTIEFQPVGGWISPAAQEVTVEPNQCTVASATYSAAGTIVINEFLAQNILGDLDPLDENDDWIELYNASAEAVDVGGMFLTDDLDDPNRWQFPLDRSAETTIPSGGYLVIWADEQPGQTPGLHANFALDVDGEEIGLFDIEGVLVDSVVFDDQVADVSFGREPDGGDTWVTLSPTIGASNDGAYLGLVADTKFSPDRGFYEAP
ncbi:MAG: lamin tail domain-containing protein, partial [Sedimentisphaerales bacterium]|nr:lamin tail domain-containing protein [Sedimentisphaerales bacterium]